MNTLSGRKHVRGFFSGIRKGIQPTMFGRAAAIIYDEGEEGKGRVNAPVHHCLYECDHFFVEDAAAVHSYS